MLLNVNVDYMSLDGGAQGEIARHVQSAGVLNANALKPFIDPSDGRSYINVFKGGDYNDEESWTVAPITGNATLRRDEWKTLDLAVIGIAEQRLTGFNYLVSKGLVWALGNAMGTTVLEWHQTGDAMEAVMTMDAVTRGPNDRPVFSTHYLPIPIIHVDYEINLRELENSRKLGNSIDTIDAERAARKIEEYKETMLFTNTQYAFGGGTIYSLINHPDRNTYSLGTTWVSDTAANIVADVIAMKQMSINDYHYGPWSLFIPTNYETVLDKDFDTTTATGRTIRERILQIANIQDVVVVDKLTASNVLLVQTTSDVVRIVRGLPIQNVEWGAEGGFIKRFKVLTIDVPQVRSDDNNRSGIVHAS